MVGGAVAQRESSVTSEVTRPRWGRTWQLLRTQKASVPAATGQVRRGSTQLKRKGVRGSCGCVHGSRLYCVASSPTVHKAQCRAGPGHVPLCQIVKEAVRAWLPNTSAKGELLPNLGPL